MTSSGADGTPCGGILSEGDKRDSKRGSANHDFAPKPASRTRPRGIQLLCQHSNKHPGRNATVFAVGWDGHVFLEGGQTLSKPTPLFQELKGIRTRQAG
jgi:hypothetical protein